MSTEGVDPVRRVQPYDVPADGVDQPAASPSSKLKLGGGDSGGDGGGDGGAGS